MKFLFPRDTRFSAITNGNCSYYYNDAFNERTTEEGRGRGENSRLQRKRELRRREKSPLTKKRIILIILNCTNRIYPTDYLAGLDVLSYRAVAIFIRRCFPAEKVFNREFAGVAHESASPFLHAERPPSRVIFITSLGWRHPFISPS